MRAESLFIVNQMNSTPKSDCQNVRANTLIIEDNLLQCFPYQSLQVFTNNSSVGEIGWWLNSPGNSGWRGAEYFAVHDDVPPLHY